MAMARVLPPDDLIVNLTFPQVKSSARSHDAGLPARCRIHRSMGEQRRRAALASRSSDLLSLGSFVLLGLPDGMLGTAWPSMRATFGAPVGDLGLILLISTAGSVLVTAVVGPLIRRLGVPTLLAVAGMLAAIGYAGRSEEHT